jgi:hypothetical protein
MRAAVSGDDRGWDGETAGSETALPLFFTCKSSLIPACGHKKPESI